MFRQTGAPIVAIDEVENEDSAISPFARAAAVHEEDE